MRRNARRIQSIFVVGSSSRGIGRPRVLVREGLALQRSAGCYSLWVIHVAPALPAAGDDDGILILKGLHGIVGRDGRLYYADVCHLLRYCHLYQFCPWPILVGDLMLWVCNRPIISCRSEISRTENESGDLHVEKDLLDERSTSLSQSEECDKSTGSAHQKFVWRTHGRDIRIRKQVITSIHRSSSTAVVLFQPSPPPSFSSKCTGSKQLPWCWKYLHCKHVLLLFLLLFIAFIEVFVEK